jgi:hypothetical protein
MSAINLQSVLDGLDHYRAQIEGIPGGVNTRLYAFTTCLKKITETRLGKDLLTIINASGKKVAICLNKNGKNSAVIRTSTIHFDPYRQYIGIVVKNGLRQMHESCPVSTLFHECVHIYQSIEKPSPVTLLDWYPFTLKFHVNEDYENLKEWDAINGRRKEDFSENAFRRELELPIRVTHNEVDVKTAMSICSLLNKANSSGKGKIQVNEKNEEQVREALFAMITRGLEKELKTLLALYDVRQSDFECVAFHPGLVFYFDKANQQFDSIRENALIFLLAHVIRRTPSTDDKPTKVFLEKIFCYSIFSKTHFVKKLCKQLPGQFVMDYIQIFQKLNEKENCDLLKDLLSQ